MHETHMDYLLVMALSGMSYLLMRQLLVSVFLDCLLLVAWLLLGLVEGALESLLE
jgi:hypothetical protein